MSECKRRGRPIGSGKNDDLALMPKIADQMVKSKMTRTAAIRAVHAMATDPSVLRRLERKFRTDEHRYIKDAQTRVVEAQQQERKARATEMGWLTLGALVLKPDQLARCVTALQEFKQFQKNVLIPNREILSAHAESMVQYNRAASMSGGVNLIASVKEEALRQP